ncbi:MAG: ATP-binding protein [Spirochaetota bacterium]
MDREKIKRSIRDGQERLASTSGVRRDLRMDHDFLKASGKAAAIIGPRRAGKTFRLFQVREELALAPERCVLLDFSDLSLQDFRAEDFEELAVAASELDPRADSLFLLDEIQEVPGFEAGIRHLQNKGHRVYVTGSNASVFTQDLATSLRGKLLCSTLFPLSFSEFLRFKAASFRADPSSEERALRRRLLDEYLVWGGFPEVVLAAGSETKRAILDSYIKVMVFRDVVERHGLRDAAMVERVLARLVSSFTKEYSVNRWFNDFKSQGLRAGKDGLYAIVHHLEDAHVIRTLANAASPAGTRKAYLIDPGYYRSFLQRDRDYGKLWENALLVGLLRKGIDPQYWSGPSGEIDFVTPDAYIQATSELSEGNRERETRPFDAVAKHLGDRLRLILTPDEPPAWL